MSDPIEAAIFEKLAKADPKNVGGKSIEPSDVAKELQPEQWQRMLPKVRHCALALMRQGRLTITKKGKVIDPNAFKGAHMQVRIVARHAHVRETGQVGIRNGDALDRMSQMAKARAKDQAEFDGFGSGAGLDGVQQISHRSVQR